MLKTSNILTPATYYQDRDYVSNSRLSNFARYDQMGNVVYNFTQYLNPPDLDSDAIMIGKIVDECLTEWVIFEEKYGEKLSKDDWIDLCMQNWVGFNKTDTIAKLQQALDSAWVQVEEKIPLPKDMSSKIQKILATAKAMQYDADTTYMQYIAECDNQMVVVNESAMLKGKFDHSNSKRKRISDLKTTGTIDKPMKEIYWGNNVNINHKYVRQWAFYRALVLGQTGERWDFELIVIAHNGESIILRIPHEAMDEAWKNIERDIEELNKYRFPWEKDSNLKTDYCVFLNYNSSTPPIPMSTEDLFDSIL